MKNFYCLARGIDVTPLMGAIMRNPQLWNQNTLRTCHPTTAHSEIDDIWLRFNRIPADGDEYMVADDRESINYPAFSILTDARPLIFGLMSSVQGERIGRCLITRLPPGGKIDAHVDSGSPADYYDRYHIVLNSSPGCVFRAGEEKVYMRTGEIWWFDNTIEHEVVNNGADDRIHLVIDIRTFKP